MNRTLIVHIGYPKTATTSLQETCLHALHREGAINFLGISHEGGDRDLVRTSLMVTRILSGDFHASLAGCRPAAQRSPRQRAQPDPHRALARRPGYFAGLLEPGTVNVLSYEPLTMPCRSAPGFRALPARLREMFDDGAVDIRIVVTLREQTRLLRSFYAEKYPALWRHPALDSPEKVFFASGRPDTASEFVQIFDFNEVADAWAAEFGRENLRFLFYEDIRNDPDAFFGPWGHLLGVAPETVRARFQARAPQRVGRRGPRGAYVCEVPLDAYLEKRGRHRLSAFLTRRRQGLSRFFVGLLHSWAKRLAPLTVTVPELPPDASARLWEHYRARNRVFGAVHDLSDEKMRRYGYYAEPATHRREAGGGPAGASSAACPDGKRGAVTRAGFAGGSEP